MPQLDFGSFPPQLIWLAITFVLLYLVLARGALPRVASVLERRKRQIEGDLGRAESLKAEAEATLAAYHKAIAEAKAAAQAELQKTAATIQAEQAKRDQAFLAEINARTAEAERRIAAVRQSAMGEAGQVAAELAQSLVAKLSDAKPGAAEAKQAVEAAMRERA